MKSLRHLTPPTTVRLKRIAAIPDRVRLMELGFLPGVEIHVMGRGATGGFLVAVGDSRMAIGDRTAGALEVVDA